MDHLALAHMLRGRIAPVGMRLHAPCCRPAGLIFLFLASLRPRAPGGAAVLPPGPLHTPLLGSVALVAARRKKARRLKAKRKTFVDKVGLVENEGKFVNGDTGALVNR